MMLPGIYPGHMSFLPHKSAVALHPVDAALTTLLSALFHRLLFHFNRQLQIGLLIFIEHACVKGICGILS